MATVRSNIAAGRLFQKRVMEKIKEIFGFNQDQIRTCVGAECGEDIKFSQDARATVGLSIECKNQKNMNIWSSLEQAKKNCPKGCEEAVVFKRKTLGANKTYIVVPLDHYLTIRGELKSWEDTYEK